VFVVKATRFEGKATGFPDQASLSQVKASRIGGKAIVFVVKADRF
jgi:hypothetical protein